METVFVYVVVELDAVGRAMQLLLQQRKGIVRWQRTHCARCIRQSGAPAQLRLLWL